MAGVIIHIAVKLRHAAIVHQPELVGGGLQQMPVMRNQNDRAFIFIDGLNQRGAAVNVEMVGRLVHDDEMRAVERGQPHEKTRLLAAGKLLHRRVGLRAGKAHLRRFGALFGLWRVGHQCGHMAVGRAFGIEIIHLMLGEKAHLHFGGTLDLAGHGLQTPRHQLGEGGFAIAISAEQADAVIIGDKQIQPAQNRCVAIADAGALHRHNRR